MNDLLGIIVLLVSIMGWCLILIAYSRTEDLVVLVMVECVMFFIRRLMRRFMPSLSVRKINKRKSSNLFDATSNNFVQYSEHAVGHQAFPCSVPQQTESPCHAWNNQYKN